MKVNTMKATVRRPHTFKFIDRGVYKLSIESIPVFELVVVLQILSIIHRYTQIPHQKSDVSLECCYCITNEMNVRKTIDLNTQEEQLNRGPSMTHLVVLRQASMRLRWNRLVAKITVGTSDLSVAPVWQKIG